MTARAAPSSAQKGKTMLPHMHLRVLPWIDQAAMTACPSPSLPQNPERGNKIALHMSQNLTVAR